MKEYKLRNKGEVIGTAKPNRKNIKKIRKYKFGVGALLTAGILAVALGTHKPEDKNTQVDKSDLEESLFDSNDIFRADTFMIPQENGNIYFVTEEYLNEHNYVPNDTIDTRYNFIVDFNDKVIHEYKDKYPDKDFSKFDKEYQNFRTIYEEYIDGDQKDSYFQQQYVLKVEEELIKTIHSYELISYVPTAIPFEDYVANTYPQNNGKYTINYEIPQDTTLSEILSYTDNNQEYKETYDEVLNNPNNNITNPDLIYAGETLELPNLDEEDLNDLGYDVWSTPVDELDQRYIWINDMLPTIDYLSGDTNSKNNIETLKKTVDIFNKSYDAYTGGDAITSFETVLYDSRSICDTIELLTGERFVPTPMKVK